MGLFDFLSSGKSKTYKPTNVKVRNQKLQNYANKTLATLGSGDMASAVRLPQGEDLNEWLAVNIVDFFNELNLIYGTICQSCTSTSCPKMSAGTHDYLWQDNARYVTPTAMPASEYVDKLMDWAESQINDESIFPLQHGQPFPRDFKKKVSAMFRRFFRVYAHVYTAHMSDIVAIKAEAHLNTCFKHFYFFIKEFQLVDVKELKPLEDIIVKFK